MRIMSPEEINSLNQRLLLKPHCAEGEVVKGFGRGSKQLGIPTANYPEEVVNGLGESFNTGVYFGWSRIDNGEIHKMVLSIGWNPYYNNEKKSMETHIIHKFENDFYGAILRTVITGFIRPEKNFDSLDALIKAIENDIKVASDSLDLPEQIKNKDIKFLRDDR